jgi:hypothetical protein
VSSTISSVPSRHGEIIRLRIASSVMTPPALRMICASPASKAEGAGRVEAGVHASQDRDARRGLARAVGVVEGRGVAVVVGEQPLRRGRQNVA